MEFDLRLHAGTRSKVLVTDYPDDTINPAKGNAVDLGIPGLICPVSLGLPVGQVSEALGKVSLPVVACRADLR